MNLFFQLCFEFVAFCKNKQITQKISRDFFIKGLYIVTEVGK